MNIQLGETEGDILKCWKALHELRPQLLEASFITLTNEMMLEGYQLAFIEGEDGLAHSVIGFRYLQFTYNFTPYRLHSYRD